MKRILKSTLMIMLVSCFFTPQVVYANMAAPNDADIGSSITFEKKRRNFSVIRGIGHYSGWFTSIYCCNL